MRMLGPFVTRQSADYNWYVNGYDSRSRSRYISKLQKHLTAANRDLVLPPSSAFEGLECFCYVGMSRDSLSSVLVKNCSERKDIFHWHNTRALAARRAKDSCPGEDTVGARTQGLREKAYRTDVLERLTKLTNCPPGS